MRVICRSTTVDHDLHIGAVAAVVFDEAHLSNVMVNVIIIDLMSEDPRYGMPIYKYFNISIYMAIGVGEEHVLTWAKRRLFKVVS